MNYTEREILKYIGLSIYVLRKERGLSAKQLGKMLGKAECTVTSWERGERIPSLVIVVRLCNTLGCSFEELLDAHSRLAEVLNKAV